MDNELNQLDKFYKKALQNHKQMAAPRVWSRMRWRIFWLNYQKYIWAISALLGLGALIYFGSGIYKNDFETNPNVEAIVKGGNEQETTKESAFEVDKNVIDKIISKKEHEVPLKNETQGAGLAEIIKAGNTEEEVGPPIMNPIHAVHYIGKQATANEQVNESVKEYFIETADLKNTSLTIDNASLSLRAHDSLSFAVHEDIKPKKSWLSVGFKVSPAYSMYTLASDMAFEDHMTYREAHESPALSVSAGLDIVFNIKNWYIQTGLQYSEFKQYRNYNNAFSALDSLSSYIQTDTIWGWIYDAPNFGEPIILAYDTTFVPVFNTTNEGYNRWNYLEIPIILGYKFKKGRLSIDAGTGVSVAFLLKAGGNIPHLTDQNYFTQLSDLQSDMNNQLYSYIFQLGASYYLTPNWQFRVSPFYKQSINPVFNKNYPVTQKFRTFGVNFGLVVDF